MRAFSAATLLAVVLLDLDINPTIFGSASLLEIIWTSAAGYGSIRNAGNLREAWRQMHFAAEPPTDPLAVGLAKLDMVVQAALLSVLVLMAIVGVMALFTPPPAVREVQTLANIIETLFLIGVPLVLMGLSEYIRRKRRSIISILPSYGDYTQCPCAECKYKVAKEQKQAKSKGE